jgi:hypothetical protein
MKIRFKALIAIVSLIAALAVAESAQSQCSMCRAVAESGNKTSDKKTGAGLNSGILYLLSVPYLLGGAAFWIWYRNRRKS